jgi:fructokinase
MGEVTTVKSHSLREGAPIVRLKLGACVSRSAATAHEVSVRLFEEELSLFARSNLFTESCPIAYGAGPMAEPAVPPVLCFGEVLWDCLPRGLFPGGAPINVAYHLQKLGITAYPVTAVGSDFLGQELIRRLEQWGLDSRFVTVLPDKQTGVVRAHIQPDGSAKYEIVEDVAWDWIEPEDEVFQMATRGASLLFGTLAQRSEHNRKRLDAVLERMAGGLKIYDVNLRPPFDNPETIRYLASKANLIKLNDEELGVVTHGLYPKLSLEKAAREYAEQVRCDRLCVTAGARGAGLLDSGQWYWVDGRSVVVRDTVGAGDSFLAALISGLVGATKRSPEAILTRACRLGEFVASSDGATPKYAVAPDGTVYPQ